MKVKRHKLQPLTETQRIFAEENHNLIYSFIHRYGYSIEEYYHILIFGYLKAVQIYFTRKDLREKYDFPFICWMYLRSEIGNYFRMEDSKFRKAENGTFSLDTQSEYFNCIIGNSIDEEILEAELLEELMENLTKVQSMIVHLKIHGYSNKEVYLLMEIKPSTYYKEMKRIKEIFERLLVCY